MRANAQGGGLRVAELHVGERCNDRCRFCSDVPDVPVDVPAEDLRARIRRYREAGAAELELSGLEPTIRPEFLDLVREARRLGYERVCVITNGRMLAYASFADEAARAGLTHVIVSIHSATAEREARITGSPDGFAQKVQGIRNAIAAGLFVECNVVVHAHNLDVLEETVGLLARLGVRRANLYAPRPYGDALTRFDEVVPPLGEAGERAVRACGAARRLGLPAFLCDWPPCVARGGEAWLGRPQAKEVAAILKTGREQILDGATKKAAYKAFGPPCKRCAARGACDGVYREYVRRRGWEEFRPLP